MHEDILPAGSQALLEVLSHRLIPELRGWTLAGGTGLALSLGHRYSTDFDFFRTDPVSLAPLHDVFREIGLYETLLETERSLTVLLQGVKLSFFIIPNPFLHPSIPWRFCSVADIRDIALMKITAIAGRGSRRDFVDLRILLQTGLSLTELFESLPRKYGAERFNLYHIVKSLAYFVDAEREPMPRMCAAFDWEECKHFFRNASREIMQQQTDAESDAPQEWVAGVDGCPAGWVVALQSVSTGEIRTRVCGKFSEVIQLPEYPKVIAVDIPIGLLDAAVRGGRVCDMEARKLLGARRASRVSPPPARPALKGKAYWEASALNRKSSADGLGISSQCFAIVPKIIEVDEALSAQPALRDVVKEIHPGLCFYEMNDRRPIAEPKKTPQGNAIRLQLLRKNGFPDLSSASSQHRKKDVAPDDLLDAYAALWTAQRIYKKIAIVIPAEPPIDSRGLRMEMWR